MLGTNAFDGLGGMIVVAVMAMLVVLFAMSVDLVSGIRKAKLRGELRTSTALKRTLTKFISYEGGMIIALGVDMLIHMSQLLHLFGLQAIYGVPVITCLVGVFLLVVEFISVREKYDAKTKKEMQEAASLLAKIMEIEGAREMLRAVIEQQDRGGVRIEAEEGGADEKK
jgi:ATP/ADP translocase